MKRLVVLDCHSFRVAICVGYIITILTFQYGDSLDNSSEVKYYFDWSDEVEICGRKKLFRDQYLTTKWNDC